MTFSVEAKLHAFRRTQEGVVVSFVVSPIDMPSQLATDPLGTRYMIALAEIGDDEQEVSPGAPVSAPAKAADIPPPRPAPGGAKKEYTLANRIGMTCNDPAFRDWLYRTHGMGGDADVAEFVRTKCRVRSRADILPGTEAAALWHALALDYETATGRMAEAR